MCGLDLAFFTAFFLCVLIGNLCVKVSELNRKSYDFNSGE